LLASPDVYIGQKRQHHMSMPRMTERAVVSGVGIDGAPPVVLLVDDDDEFRTAFVELLLSEEELDVVEAATGEAALAHLEAAGRGREQRLSLIVIDLMMPSISGLELLQRLRRHPRWRSIPVMVMTAVNDPMLPVRLDVPVAYKLDYDSVRTQVMRQLARVDSRH